MVSFACYGWVIWPRHMPRTGYSWVTKAWLCQMIWLQKIQPTINYDGSDCTFISVFCSAKAGSKSSGKQLNKCTTYQLSCANSYNYTTDPKEGKSKDIIAFMGSVVCQEKEHTWSTKENNLNQNVISTEAFIYFVGIFFTEAGRIFNL